MAIATLIFVKRCKSICMGVCEPASRSESAPRGCPSQLDWHSTAAALAPDLPLAAADWSAPASIWSMSGSLQA